MEELHFCRDVTGLFDPNGCHDAGWKLNRSLIVPIAVCRADALQCVRGAHLHYQVNTWYTLTGWVSHPPVDAVAAVTGRRLDGVLVGVEVILPGSHARLLQPGVGGWFVGIFNALGAQGKGITWFDI